MMMVLKLWTKVMVKEHATADCGSLFQKFLILLELFFTITSVTLLQNTYTLHLEFSLLFVKKFPRFLLSTPVY